MSVASEGFEWESALRSEQNYTELDQFAPELLSPAKPIIEGRQLAARPEDACRAGKFFGDGLLHDARNLVGAIGLYCDLLSMPGVLKPEHRKYSDELRLLGVRSQEMIEHLMRSLDSQQRVVDAEQRALPVPAGGARYEDSRTARSRPDYWQSCRAEPVSLKAVVERCCGLLSRVGNGCAVEAVYGPAAEMPVRIAEEALERILVNLVRNGSAAQDTEMHSGKQAAVRISVGTLTSAVGAAQAWPFARVRLTVEDFGCGMEPQKLEALLSGRNAARRGNHGIGFRVVRELVSATNGELRATSAPGIGTRIQIEWPVASVSTAGREEEERMRERATRTEQNPAVEKAIARSGGDRAVRPQGQMQDHGRRGAN
jgi:signal transduction histidine kinase